MTTTCMRVVGKTAQTPKDEYTFADVKDVTKLVSKDSLQTHSCVRPVRPVKLSVLTASDASFSKVGKDGSQEGFITTVTTCGVGNERTV